MSERTPQRIQLSRRRGWRKPDGVIVVARPSCWGNPFRVGQPLMDGFATIPTREHAVSLYTNWLTNTLDQDGNYITGKPDYLGAPASERPSIEEIREQLRGHDLACWCPIGEPCHGDVLLRIANA